VFDELLKETGYGSRIVSKDPEISVVIHRKKKDGGCTFYHNTLRTKLSQLGIWKDMV